VARGGGRRLLGEKAFVGQSELDSIFGIMQLRVAINSPWSSVAVTVLNLFPVTSYNPGWPSSFLSENQQFLTSKAKGVAAGVPPCSGVLVSFAEADAAMVSRGVLVSDGVPNTNGVLVALGLHSTLSLNTS
jgi:hypothetical protein